MPSLSKRALSREALMEAMQEVLRHDPTAAGRIYKSACRAIFSKTPGKRATRTKRLLESKNKKTTTVKRTQAPRKTSIKPLREGVVRRANAASVRELTTGAGQDGKMEDDPQEVSQDGRTARGVFGRTRSVENMNKALIQGMLIDDDDENEAEDNTGEKGGSGERGQAGDNEEDDESDEEYEESEEEDDEDKEEFEENEVGEGEDDSEDNYEDDSEEAEDEDEDDGEQGGVEEGEKTARSPMPDVMKRAMAFFMPKFPQSTAPGKVVQGGGVTEGE